MIFKNSRWIPFKDSELRELRNSLLIDESLRTVIDAGIHEKLFNSITNEIEKRYAENK